MELKVKAKPFLRWAGGKTWFVKHFRDLFPTVSFNNYHEPFLGSGALFFHLAPYSRSYLSDLNNELIETYLAIKTDPQKVINELKRFKNTEDEYYKIREAKYKTDFRCAARFIFLNQTSFNGIYRVNLRGQYNVPYGFRQKNFLDAENLRLVSKCLENTELATKDFFSSIKNVKKNDLVFLDPPYTISHNNNGFFKYNQKLFSEVDQYRLSDAIDEIKKRKAFYILSNAAHEKVKQIFDKKDRMMEFKRASLIGGINANRGKYEELIITNIS